MPLPGTFAPKGYDVANSTSPNDSPNSVPMEAHLCREAAANSKLYRANLKFQLADQARKMQDNQRILDTTLADDRALREQRHRFRERQAGGDANTNPVAGPQWPATEEEMGDILIDSPTHHHYPAPPTPVAPPATPAAQATPTWAKWLAAGAIAAGGGGAGYLANSVLTRPTAPPVTVQQQPATNTTTNTTKGFLIELMPAPPAQTKPQ